MSVDFKQALNILAGTSGLDENAAANAFAGTTNYDVLGALNVAAGTWGKGLNKVCNLIAGTSGLDAQGALNTLITAGGNDPLTSLLEATV